MKAFRIQTLDTGQDVLGGTVGEDNAYIRAYGAVVAGYPAVEDLEIGEVTRKEYALSGQKRTTYAIVRVEP